MQRVEVTHDVILSRIRRRRISHSITRFLDCVMVGVIEGVPRFARDDRRSVDRGNAMPEQWDDSGGSRWQCPEPCLSIVSKFSRRPERADADVSVSDARNSFLKGDRMAVMAAVAAVLSCAPINIQTTSLICSTSQLLKRKTEDTGAGKKCTARMRRTRSSRFRSERWFTNCGVGMAECGVKGSDRTIQSPTSKIRLMTKKLLG